MVLKKMNERKLTVQLLLPWSLRMETIEANIFFSQANGILRTEQ